MPTRLLPLCSALLAAAALSVAPAAQSALPTFTDATKAAGIAFTHENGAFGKKYLPETMGAGAAFLDADGDGWQDVLLINSTTWPGRPGRKAVMALYRNNRNGTFADVTARAGLDVPLYGLGVAAADYDNDGRIDIYVTALGRNRLFHNDGGLRFTDVTATAGVGDEGFSTSAAWFDYDRDGRLDLYVANYVRWSIDKDLFCTLDGKTKSYCTPESYQGQSGVLYHNLGNGRFEDATRQAGLFEPTSKGLGVALLDYNGDGWLDLFVSNDTQPNRLYENRRNGTFTDVGVSAGVAFNEAGVARAGMGVDAADYDGSGRQSLIIGNFSNEMMALYNNEGNGLFIDEAPRSALGRASLLTLTFGCFFFDYDLDGRPDIFAANGHVADDITAVQPRVHYRQPPHLFRNLGSRRFEEVTAQSGADFQTPVVARGAAHGDYDNDGDQGRHRLRVDLRLPSGQRAAIGASARVVLPAGPSAWQMVKTGSSYLSQNELPLSFGLDQAARLSGVEIKWPDGTLERLPAMDADATLVVEKGKGVVSRTPFGAGAR